MRRVLFLGILVSAVAHVVAVTLLIMVVERITALPGLFVDLTIHATESNSPSRPGGEARTESKPPGTRAKRPPAWPMGASRVLIADSASPRTGSSPELPEPTRRSGPAIAADSVADAPAPTNVAPPAIAPNARRSVDASSSLNAPTSVDARTSVDAQPSASATASGDRDSSSEGTSSPGISAVGAGRSRSGDESTTIASGVPGGGGFAARAGRGLALATPGAGGGPGGSGSGRGGLAPEYGEYLAHLRQRIQESLRYPLTARRRGLSGTVHLELTIRPDGAIAEVTVVESSSYSALDDAALEAVRSLRPMPFPPGVLPRRLDVRLPVIFKLPEFGER